MMKLKKESSGTWEELVERLRESIPTRYPEWTDYNVHDPGITILEFLAWMTQAQMYHASRLGEQHWEKCLKMSGIKKQRRMPGRTMVTVEAAEGSYLASGTRFYAGSIGFEMVGAQMVEEYIFRSFRMISGAAGQTLEGRWMASGKGIGLYPFGENPRAGDLFVIELNRPLQKELPYRLSISVDDDYPVTRRRVEEEAFDGHGFYPLADICLEYQTEQGWHQVAVTQDDTYGFCQSGSICFTLPLAMMEEQWQLRFRLRRSDYLVAPKLVRISMAMVEVLQQETCGSYQQPYAKWPGTGLPDQCYELDHADIVVPELLLEAEHECRPGQMDVWEQVDDFDCSQPEDRHYRLIGGVIWFGDGFHGAIPEGMIRIIRLVRTLGADGNIKSGTIRRMEGSETAVVNEGNVEGGRSEMTAKEAVKSYAEEPKPLLRAVTSEDYKQLVMAIPGLMIADCRVYCEYPAKREICIAVKPYTADGFRPLNEAYRKNIFRYLEEKRLIGTRLRIVSPEYYDIEIACVIAVSAGQGDVGVIVEQEIRSWIGKKRFGEGIRQGELHSRIGTIPGVRRVESLRIEAGTRIRRNQEGDLLLPHNGLFRIKRVECR